MKIENKMHIIIIIAPIERKFVIEIRYKITAHWQWL